MKLIAILLAIALPACDLNLDKGLNLGCVALCSPPLTVPLVGAGMAVTVAYMPPADHAIVTVESSDPSIADAVLTGAAEGYDLQVTGHRVGTAVLTVYDASTHETVTAATVTVVAVDKFAVYSRALPGFDQPLASVAGLAGSRDSFAVTWLTRGGEQLDGTGSITVRGSGLSLVSGTTDRLSDLLIDRSRVEVGFADSGAGELVVGLLDGSNELAIPIDIVPAAATLEIVTVELEGGALAPDPVSLDDPLGSDIIGLTSDGRLVAGVTAQWSSIGAVESLGDNTGSEFVFQLTATGTAEVTATVGAQTVTQHLNDMPGQTPAAPRTDQIGGSQLRSVSAR